MATTDNTKLSYLQQMASTLIDLIYQKSSTNPRITRVEQIRGPRAGSLSLYAGPDSGDLYQLLTRSDNALARQAIPWSYPGGIAVYFVGKALRVEAPWPATLAESNIQVSQLSSRGQAPTRWIAGKSELGATVSLEVSDRTPHWLVSGTTGSGKTYAMRSAIWQLAKYPTNTFILIDGKMGEGFYPLRGIPRLIGPIATNEDFDEILLALRWAVAEMEHRYTLLNERYLSSEKLAEKRGRLIIAIDELQELSAEKEVVLLVRKLVAQGRAARVHMLVGTQQPTADVFKDRTIKTNLPGRIALRTTHLESSRAALGQSTPRADWLMGHGDAYCAANGMYHRTQLAYVAPEDLVLPGSPILADWPCPDVYYNANDLGGFTSQELAIGMLSQASGWGRTLIRRQLATVGLTMGKPKIERLRRYTQEIYKDLVDLGYTVRKIQ